jgi:hypothetical protein
MVEIFWLVEYVLIKDKCLFSSKENTPPSH